MKPDMTRILVELLTSAVVLTGCETLQGAATSPEYSRTRRGAAYNEFGDTVIEVAGHTDSTGTAAYNQTLFQRRAQSVAAYLTSHGVKQQRLIVVGAGEDHPVADNNTTEGRAKNRRVELTIVPVEKKA